MQERVRACLERIDALEPTIKAWAALRREALLEAAQARGPLQGLPVGIKEIFDVAGLPTTAGAGDFLKSAATHDSDVVARLKAAGAVILGTTVSTQFAFLDPAPTRNPRNLARTPGGSSSGSAAAVAAGMVPAAIGSQTGSSTLRPASYCGVVGFKPTYDRVSRDGMFPASPSLDHVGILAENVATAALVFDALCDTMAFPAMQAPRLGLVREYFSSVESTAARLQEAGASVVEVQLPDSFRDVHAAAWLITQTEAAAVHAARFATNPDIYKPALRAHIEAGLRVAPMDYQRAREMQTRFRGELDPILAEVDALLLPTTPTPAPPFEDNGDGRFCMPWSFAGVPALSLPSGTGDLGLPLAVQLVGRASSDERLLATARWCEERLG